MPPLPPIVYLMFIIAVSSFGIGAGIMHKFDKGEIAGMKAAIEKVNTDSSAVLAKAKSAVAAAQTEAINTNKELDTANAQSIETINHYHATLANTRLRDPGATRCSNSLPSSNSSGVNQSNEANGADLSEKLSGLLLAETLRADKSASDKNTLLAFVQGNCGIKK